MAPILRLVDSSSGLEACLEVVAADPPPSSVAVDLEGVNLGRDGRVAIIQLQAEGSNIVWLIDVTTLGALAFSLSDERGKTLRGVLEGMETRKVFWDVRNDSDALFAHFGIRLSHTYDLQLLELLVRYSNFQNVRLLHSLGRSMERFGLASHEWKQVKQQGISLFAPECGGSYAVFETRPLDSRLVQYCAQDVSLLLDLEQVMRNSVRAGRGNESFIIRESAARVTRSWSRTYRQNGSHKALAPLIK